MPEQTLMWTALPNGLTNDGRGIKVSVLLSPRLKPGPGDAEKLASFPEWLNWPKMLSQATFSINYSGGKVAVTVSQIDGRNHVDTSVGSLDSDAWKAIFHGDLFVRGFQFKDLSGNKVLSYDTVAVETLVKDLYENLAQTATDELPQVSTLVDAQRWQELISSVAEIDQRYAKTTFDPQTEQRTVLRDPSRQFAEFRDGDMPFQNPVTKTLAEVQLFHTPPSTPKPVERKPRDDDDDITASWLEYEQSELPDEHELAKQLDFHQVVAAMNQYPTLLRRLGLVVDFVLDRRRFSDTPDLPLSVTVHFPDNALTNATHVSPITHSRLWKESFQPVSNPLLHHSELRVVDGLLDLNPQKFQLLQADVDGAGLKLMNFARTLSRRVPDEERVDSVTRFEHEYGAPALRTAGLMLVHRDRGSSLQQRFEDNAKKNSAAVGGKPPELWAEDLVRGFRFDIWDSSTAAWRSLCQRMATYSLNDGQVVINVEEEGTVRMAATKSADPASNADLVYLHEALVAWAGYSLAAPPPGRAILPDGSVDKNTNETVAEVPPGVPVSTRFNAKPGSLPRLRFGRSYWLRGRIVDLAGNSLPALPGSFGTEEPEKHKQTFLRYEPIAPPVIALVKPEGADTEVPAEGESMERIAIRSFNDTPPDNHVKTNQEARRFAVPPQSSVRDAEQHGMLDAGGIVDPSKFDLLANQKDRDIKDPDAAIQQQLIPMQGPLDPNPVDTLYAVYRDGVEMTYLPDPLAEEVAVRVFRHPNIDNNDVIIVPLYPKKLAPDGTAIERHWPDARPFQIRVFEDPHATPSYDAATHTLLVPLPKAIRAKVRLSMKPSGESLMKLGIWNWLSDSDREALEEGARNGQHWMLTPWRTIDVVHAVQRPLIEPKITKHAIDRFLRATNAKPRFQAKCSIKSTDRMDLLAEWHEPIDDPAATVSKTIAADQTHRDTAFGIKVSDPETYAMQLDGHFRGGISEHTIEGDDVIGVGMPGDDRAQVKHHEFYDTRYRRIEYWLQATTRFREYLPTKLIAKQITDENGEVKLVPIDDHIKVTGPRIVEWIPNSAPPPAPEVLYVVPTFGWVRTKGEDGDLTSWRRGGGLRVYLNRPWMASGYGEMLAVVLPPASFTGDPDKQPEADPYKNLVTQWGNDPIWLSPFVSGIAPKRSDFPLARTAPDLAGNWLPASVPVDSNEADQRPGPFAVKPGDGLSPPGGLAGSPFEIAPHDVYYDADRRLWYCDIEINHGASYFPFIRLSLARYQPTSVTGAHLSEVVLADFMPLTADRWLHVNQTESSRTRRVAVYGHTYHDSSGRRETTHMRGAAEISRTSVIKVWGERLDPSQGEDFGWQKVREVVVQPDQTPGPADSATAASNYLSGPDIARAVELRHSGKYDLIAREKLIDHIIQVQPLWNGTVTLPADSADGIRYRLVIAEYEEYLADDDEPYADPPKRMERRLVFVEHVELK